MLHIKKDFNKDNKLNAYLAKISVDLKHIGYRYTLVTINIKTDSKYANNAMREHKNKTEKNM